MSELTPNLKLSGGAVFKIAVVAIFLLGLGIISANSFFYAEPGYIY